MQNTDWEKFLAISSQITALKIVLDGRTQSTSNRSVLLFKAFVTLE